MWEVLVEVGCEFGCCEVVVVEDVEGFFVVW